jgi:hypothetical protein
MYTLSTGGEIALLNHATKNSTKAVDPAYTNGERIGNSRLPAPVPKFPHHLQCLCVFCEAQVLGSKKGFVFTALGVCASVEINKIR